MNVLFATTNPAKVQLYGPLLQENNINLLTLKDLATNQSVEENGKDPIENAVLKARFYQQQVNIPVIALDDGLFLEGLPNELQPGTHVRRVNNQELTDKEMLDYYIKLINKYSKSGILKGYFLKGVAIVYQDKIYTTSFKRPVVFKNELNGITHLGYPLDSLLLDENNPNENKSTKEDVSHFLLNTLLNINEKKVK